MHRGCIVSTDRGFYAKGDVRGREAGRRFGPFLVALHPCIREEGLLSPPLPLLLAYLQPRNLPNPTYFRTQTHTRVRAYTYKYTNTHTHTFTSSIPCYRRHHENRGSGRGAKAHRRGGEKEAEEAKDAEDVDAGAVVEEAGSQGLRGRSSKAPSSLQKEAVDGGGPWDGQPSRSVRLAE